MKRFYIIMGMLLLVSSLFAQSAEEIVSRMDSIQSAKSSRVVGSIFITDRFGVKQSDFISWSDESGDFLLEFTSVAEQGQKILRKGKIVYLFFPEAEDLMRLQGSSLKQGLMGSDISYEDMTEGNSTLDKYSCKKLDDFTVDGVDCWQIELIGKSRAVPYYRRVLYVQKSNYLPKKEGYYSKSGKLIKEMRIFGYKKVSGLWFITEMEIVNKLRKNSSTRMVIKDVSLNIVLDKTLFTTSSLMM